MLLSLNEKCDNQLEELVRRATQLHGKLQGLLRAAIRLSVS